MMASEIPARSTASTRRRRPLWLLAVPVVLYLLTPVIANTIHPIVLGMPFIVFYTVGVTVLTWACVWLTARLDPVYHSDADEPVPADIAFGEAQTGHAPRDFTDYRAGKPAP